MQPELVRRLESCCQQIRIPSAVVGRIEYRRQIDSLIDPIRDGLWPEPCIDLRCDGTIDQQIVDIRPRAESRREHPMLGQHSVLGSVIIDRFDAIPLAYIHAQINERLIRVIADGPVSAPLAVAHFDSNCLVVVPG